MIVVNFAVVRSERATDMLNLRGKAATYDKRTWIRGTLIVDMRKKNKKRYAATREEIGISSGYSELGFARGEQINMPGL